MGGAPGCHPSGCGLDEMNDSDLVHIVLGIPQSSDCRWGYVNICPVSNNVHPTIQINQSVIWHCIQKQHDPTVNTTLINRHSISTLCSENPAHTNLEITLSWAPRSNHHQIYNHSLSGQRARTDNQHMVKSSHLKLASTRTPSVVVHFLNFANAELSSLVHTTSLTDQWVPSYGFFDRSMWCSPLLPSPTTHCCTNRGWLGRILTFVVVRIENTPKSLHSLLYFHHFRRWERHLASTRSCPPSHTLDRRTCRHRFCVRLNTRCRRDAVPRGHTLLSCSGLRFAIDRSTLSVLERVQWVQSPTCPISPESACGQWARSKL